MKKIKENTKIKANAIATKKTLITLNSMVVKNIKNQYRRSVLGILWTVLNPLLNMIVMVLVFSKMLKFNVDIGDYPVYVLIGNIVFSLMRTATFTSLTSIVNNYDLLTKTRIKHSIFPISCNLSALVNFAFSLIALLIVMIIRRFTGSFRFQWTTVLVLLPWLPYMLMFNIGISLFLSAIYVRFRDIKHIYTVFLTLWMYLTPLFYSVKIIHDEKIVNLIKLNPMYHFVTFFRDVAMLGIIPDLKANAICFGWSFMTLLVGLLFFVLSKKKFVFYI